MFSVQALFTTVLAFLALSIHATPLFRRDVIAPTITSPNADSVWPIGTVQTVTWDTSNFPAQITNPIGQVILGFNSSGSLNLNFSDPLAQGFNLTDGSVNITVPNVPPRDDYLIVLFGDSGDTSPTFAITRISSAPGSSSSSLTATTTTITGSATPGESFTRTGDTSAAATVSNGPLPTATSPSSSSSPTSASSSSSSSSSSLSASTSPATTPTSAASSLRQGGSMMSFNALAICMVSMIMFTTV